MTFLDLFAGIGGFRLGMEMAGHECLGHCEIDKFAEKSYRAMHEPKKGEWSGGDIRTVGAADLPRADAWCFGFPCQAFSVAGSRRGFEDTRGTLFFEVMRLAAARKPAVLFAENVTGLLTHDGGRTFGVILRAMDGLGYDVEWQVLNSKNFGVPQNRERVFIVGHFRGRSGGKIFPLGRKGETTNHKQVKQIGNVLPTATRDNPNQGRVYDTEGIAPCLNGMGGGGREPMIVTAGRIGTHQTDLVQSPEGIARTLKATDFKNPQKVAVSGVYTGQSPGFQRPPLEGLSRTLKANMHDAGVTDGQRVRKLTPRECFRLQGFPDEYFERAAAVNSDTQLYKQAGNSVTVNVIYEIARRLE